MICLFSKCQVSQSNIVRPFKKKKKKRKQRAGCLPHSTLWKVLGSYGPRLGGRHRRIRSSTQGCWILFFRKLKASLGYMSLSQGKRKDELEIQLSNGGFA